MLTRRDFLGAGAASLAALFLTPIGCGGAVYEFRVQSADRGLSVYAATARHYQVGVSPNAAFRRRFGSAKVTHIDGNFSDHWVFEIDGHMVNGSFDAAERTRVRAGQLVTWREV